MLGFDLTGNFLPSGVGTLASIEFNPMTVGGTISVSAVVLSGVDGNDVANFGPQDTDFPACANADLDSLCDVADDCSIDADNDADGDGICGDVDEYPNCLLIFMTVQMYVAEIVLDCSALYPWLLFIMDSDGFWDTRDIQTALLVMDLISYVKNLAWIMETVIHT